MTFYTQTRIGKRYFIGRNLNYAGSFIEDARQTLMTIGERDWFQSDCNYI